MAFSVFGLLGILFGSGFVAGYGLRANLSARKRWRPLAQ
jgi:hypothetical protein